MHKRAILLSILYAALACPAAYAQADGIQVLSATVKDQKIAGATVILQRNGARSDALTTDANGHAPPATGMGDEGTLLILKKAGYSDLIVKCPCSGLSYAMSPVMQALDGLRIVLTWGEQPQDLDSHVAYPGNHVYYESKDGDNANLDVDDTDSYGPETITLKRKHQGEIYLYSVHNFTGREEPTSNTLSASDAKVFVYVGESLVRTYYVPRDRAGNLWNVFRIDGNGEFEDINQVTGTEAESSALDSLMRRNADTAVHAASVPASDVQRAKELNHAGEQAYHAGQMETAIDLYRQTIELDPNLGQAYSNLGLAYVKLKRPAEAIWASRKAIALASGPNAATLRAASYFNIGKLYENAGQFEDALNNYQSARNEKANPTYDRAIQRVRGR